MDEGFIIVPCIVFMIIGVLVWNLWLMIIPGLILAIIFVIRAIQMRKEEKYARENQFKDVNKS